MNGADVERALRDDAHASKIFRGVFSLDGMAKRLDVDENAATSLYVFNTHNSSQPGEHWMAMVMRGRTAYYFDSFGRHPRLYPTLSAKLERACDRVYYSTRLFQDLSSTACGDYCLLFALLTSRGWSLQRFVNWLAMFNDSEERDHVLRLTVTLLYGTTFHSSYRQNRGGLTGLQKLHAVRALNILGRECSFA